MNKLNQLAQEVHQIAKEKGFWNNTEDLYDPKGKNTAEMLMLMVSELGEACESDRKAKYVKPESLKVFDGYINEEMFAIDFETHIKDTFEDEIADTLIRIMDFCGGKGIDISRHVELKLKYNKTRPYKHGKKY